MDAVFFCSLFVSGKTFLNTVSNGCSHIVYNFIETVLLSVHSFVYPELLSHMPCTFEHLYIHSPELKAAFSCCALEQCLGLSPSRLTRHHSFYRTMVKCHLCLPFCYWTYILGQMMEAAMSGMQS